MIWNFTVHVQYKSVLIILLQEVRPASTTSRQEDEQEEKPRLEDELVWLDRIEEGKGRGFIDSKGMGIFFFFFFKNKNKNIGYRLVLDVQVWVDHKRQSHWSVMMGVLFWGYCLNVIMGSQATPGEYSN